MKIGPRIKARRAERGISQEDLALAAGTTQSTIDRIEKDAFKRMPSALPKIATVLELSLRDLGFDVADTAREGFRQPPEFLGDRDLKVFAAVEGGPGEMVVSTDPIELVPRPWYMREVRDGYAVLVVGESMVPAFNPGDMAIVNPRLPPMRGKDVILVGGEEEGEFRASIKHLEGWDAKNWHLRQFNPPRGEKPELAWPKKDWPKALRVVGKYYGG